MRNKLLIALVLCLSTVYGQSGHAIRMKVKGLIPQKTCFLGYYNSYGGVTDVSQSVADPNGYMNFTGEKPLLEGLYKITITPTKSLDVVISGQQDFSLTTDTLDFLNLTKFYGSVENQNFYDYQSKAQKNQIELRKLTNSTKKQDSLLAENKKLKESYLKKNENTLAAKIIKAGSIPEPKEVASTADYYQFYQNHFWDNVDLTDPRMLRTHFLSSNLDQYVDKLTHPSVDSLYNASVRLLEKTKGNQDVFRFFLSTLVRKFENPVINGTEEVYVKLAEKYYLAGQATWLDNYTLNQIKTRVNTMKPLLLGKVFPDLELKNPDGAAFKISDIDAKYLVVIFYSPTCSHCKATLPKVKVFEDQYEARGAKVLAVSVREGGTVWKNFITEYNLVNMQHGWENRDDSFYYYNYDVTIFPTLYVLDADKRIIGRKLAGEELGSFIDYTEGK